VEVGKHIGPVALRSLGSVNKHQQRRVKKMHHAPHLVENINASRQGREVRQTPLHEAPVVLYKEPFNIFIYYLYYL
jgi:hypothetical protein